jgi:type I restriction enzyme S subunit
MELLKREAFPRPPADEQSAIIRFLEHANAGIRRFIHIKQKLLKLLEEEKRAIINRVVTRGIDPAISLKPSSVPGLSEVPEHWGEGLLGRHLTLIEQGWSPLAAEGDLAEEQWAVLTLSAVKRGRFNPHAIKPIDTKAEVPSILEVREGDILLTRSNTRELVGDVCVVDTVRPKTIICDLIYRLHVDREILLPKFLMYQLLAPIGRHQIERDAQGSSGTMPKITQRHIRAWRIVAPPLSEQRQIVDMLDKELEGLREAMERVDREIALLREFRTRLVVDVVTGSVDVREAVKNLPAETLESEPLDEIDELSQDETAADDPELEAADAA